MKNDEEQEWFEQDSFWLDTYDFLFPTERMEAAEQEYAKAQFSLGLMYEHGEGVPKDFRQAIYWKIQESDPLLFSLIVLVRAFRRL